MKDMHTAVDAIKKANIILIAGHRNPDGDAIGSMLALGIGLRQIGKKVSFVSVDGVPRMYQQLPGAHAVKRSARRRFDLAISVDCSTPVILGSIFKTFKKAKAILEIDHHPYRIPFGTISLVDPEAAAVGEIIYYLLRALDIPMSKDIAQNILTSIIVETNSFKLPHIRPETFQLCGELLKTGISFYGIADMVFWSQTRQSAILNGLCLSRVRFVGKGRIAWSILYRKDLARVKGRKEDVDNAVEQIRSIKDVSIVVLFREIDSTHIRVSLRSKGAVNIAAVAEQFEGGGHFDSAGCVIPNTKKAQNAVLRASQKILNT